jgi:AraC-like DNA-binding protein
MQFAEIQPLAALAGFVDRIWMLEAPPDAGAAGDPILPDGRPELVLHLGDPFELVDDGRAVRQAPILFAGQLPSRLILRPTGRTAVLGVRFHPHGAAALLSVPQHELMGAPFGLDDLHPALKRDVAAVRDSARGLHDAAALIQQVLQQWIRPNALDARVAFAVEAIARARGRLSIDRIARDANITRRHLERRFLDHVGVTPKRLARIARFQHALQLLESGDAGSGAATAAACGYADQSHFVRDFRKLAGCPPSAHLLRRAQMTGLFIGSDRDRTG